MSNSQKVVPAGLEWLTQVGKGYAPENAVENQIRMPYAQVYNGLEINMGADGGLFIKKAIVQEFFGGIENVVLNPNVFVETIAKFKDDKTGEIHSEEGWIAKEYRLIVLGCDHNNYGRPQAHGEEDTRKKGKVRWYFTACAYIREFFNPDLPFKLTYGGAASAIGMSQIMRHFDEYVVGNVTTMRRKAIGPSTPPACRHEFYLPVAHGPEFVKSKEGDGSWACPAQPFGTDPKGWKFDADNRKSGEPVLKHFKMNPEAIGKLFIGAYPASPDGRYPAGPELIARCVEAVAIYPKEVCINTDEKNPEAAARGAWPDFIEDGDSKTPGISEDQIKFISYLEGRLHKLAEPQHYTIDGEIQVMRGMPDGLKGGSDKSNILMLSKPGATKLIDHLKKLVTQHGGSLEEVGEKATSASAPEATAPALPPPPSASLPPAANALEALNNIDTARNSEATTANAAPALPAGLDQW